MAISKEYPVNFTPRGLADAWDASDAFHGACRSLQNLVFDQSNPDLIACRPGVGSPITTFSGFTSPTAVTLLQVIGNYAIGLVSTSRLGSFDEPFVYNIATNTFSTITGTLSTNLPVTQPTTGDWITPTLEMVGNSIIMTHPGFNGNAQTGTFTASIAINTNLLVVTSAGTAGTAGALHVGANITGTNITANTAIIGFVAGSGTEGGVGTYILNKTYAAAVASESMTATSANYFGILDVTSMTNPVWYSTNTAVNPLPSVPSGVSNFNNRSYFICGNTVYYSDSLIPAQMTNAGQSLIVGDNTPIQCLVGLPVQTSTAGIVQALIVFKSFSIWQITGDAAITNSLSINFLSLNVGCTSPNTTVQTPIGLFFLGIDGAYYVSQLGQVLPLTKEPGKFTQDVQKPFQNIINPTRANAAFSGSIYRVSITTTINNLIQNVDYWFDVTVRRWNGPHTFGYDYIANYSNYFIVSNRTLGAKLFSSQYIPTITSVYNDNGTQLTVNMQTCFLPKTQNINVKQCIESTVELSSESQNVQYNLTSYGENFQILNSCAINASNPVYTWGTVGEGGSGAIWGTLAEGGSGAVWSTAAGNPITYFINWTQPLVFKKLAFQITTTSSYQVEIGAIFFKYIDCGYTNI